MKNMSLGSLKEVKDIHEGTFQAIAAYGVEKTGVMPMDYSAFVPIRGTIINISGTNDCCSQMITLRADDGVVNFNVSSQTLIIDNRQLRPGLEVVAFYDAGLPVPLIFPPQYRARIVAVVRRNQQVVLSYFDRNLLSEDRSLQLNTGPGTTVQTVNGQNTRCRPGNRTLLVFYSATTRSLPPQTTPEKIVVLC